MGDKGNVIELPKVGKSPFDIGDESELAKCLAWDLDETYEEPAVFDLGQVYTYRKREGIWRAMTDSELGWMIQTYSGRRIGKDDDKPKIVRVSNNTVKGVINLLQGNLQHHSGANFFTSGPKGISFRNVFVEWTPDGKGMTKSHSASNRSRIALPYDYDPYAAGPRWSQYLADVFAPDSDGPEKAELLQQFVGACLLGQATRYQRAMMLTGDGANGKSVFLSVIAQLFPPEARKAIPPQDLGDDNKGAEIASARINIVGEVPDKRILSGDTFKAIVAGDEITRRLVYKRSITFKPECGHIFSANSLPLGADASPGFWRRWLVVPFNRTFTVAEQDPYLAESIIADEMPAVAAWAIAGAAALAARKGYTIPASSEAIRNEWRIASNPVEQFVNDRCERGGREYAKHVYEVYREWCVKNGYSPLNVMNFGIRLRELGISKRHTEHGTEYDIDVKPERGGHSPI